jgi:short-subunit dehydrogenase
MLLFDFYELYILRYQQPANDDISYLDDGAAAVYRKTTVNIVAQYMPEHTFQCRSNIHILSSLISASASSNSSSTGSASKRVVRALHNAVQALLNEHAVEVWCCNDIDTAAATAWLLSEQ